MIAAVSLSFPSTQPELEKKEVKGEMFAGKSI